MGILFFLYLVVNNSFLGLLSSVITIIPYSYIAYNARIMIAQRIYYYILASLRFWNAICLYACKHICKHVCLTGACQTNFLHTQYLSIIVSVQ
jgi:hypothetical protein